MIIGCGKSDNPPAPSPTLNVAEAKINYDKTFQFALTNGEASSWTSSDETVGTINTAGLFTAKKIGESTITATVAGTKLTAKVVVDPYIKDFADVLFKKGISIDDVLKFEKRELVENLRFMDSDRKNVIAVVYRFDEFGFLGIDVGLTRTIDAREKFVTYLKERYPQTKYSSPSYLEFQIGNEGIALMDEKTKGAALIFRIR